MKYVTVLAQEGIKVIYKDTFRITVGDNTVQNITIIGTISPGKNEGQWRASINKLEKNMPTLAKKMFEDYDEAHRWLLKNRPKVR